MPVRQEWLPPTFCNMSDDSMLGSSYTALLDSCESVFSAIVRTLGWCHRRCVTQNSNINGVVRVSCRELAEEKMALYHMPQSQEKYCTSLTGSVIDETRISPIKQRQPFLGRCGPSASNYQGEYNYREYTCVHVYRVNMDAERMQRACVLGAD